MWQELENPFILIHEKKITSVQSIIPVLELVVKVSKSSKCTPSVHAAVVPFFPTLVTWWLDMFLAIFNLSHLWWITHTATYPWKLRSGRERGKNEAVNMYKTRPFLKLWDLMFVGAKTSTYCCGRCGEWSVGHSHCQQAPRWYEGQCYWEFPVLVCQHSEGWWLLLTEGLVLAIFS